ncbi:hypothetical protein Daus18300_002845 [Diaporthe australafricana]|uniref:2EXR domain-containing protein n=1 Tax=Diaporthe australafricana TaxID=127596 RepID=A0ABR3XKZ1_9PEZI
MGYAMSKLPVTSSWPPTNGEQSKDTINKDTISKDTISKDQNCVGRDQYRLNTTGNAEHDKATEQLEAPTTFYSYRKLPVEVKYMIWEHTLPTDRRVIEMKKVLNCGSFHLRMSQPTPDAVNVALSVDRASRALVFRNYVPLKLDMRIKPTDYDIWEDPGRMGVKLLFPAQTVFMSERLGDTVVAKDRHVLVFPYRPATHGLDTLTATWPASPTGATYVVLSSSRLDHWLRPVASFPHDWLLRLFKEEWNCLPQQGERDSPPVGWEAEVDFWNSPHEHNVPYILEFKGRKPGACRRLEKGSS